MGYATTVPPIREREPRMGGRGPRPPRSYDRGGGGGGGRGDGGSDDERLRRARFGMLITVFAVGVLFASLAGFYLLRQSAGVLQPDTGAYVRAWHPAPLPFRLLLVNTLVLLASSVTLEVARRKLRREAWSGWAAADNAHYSSLWLAATVLLGFLFLDGQWMAWEKVHQQSALALVSPAASFFYLLSGTHALHLLGGLIALAVAALLALLRRALNRRYFVLEVTAMYWHFMVFLWVSLLALLYFAR
jgi:cytochrome c oxidase subunit 3